MCMVPATSKSQRQENGKVAPPQGCLVSFAAHHATVEHYMETLTNFEEFDNGLCQPKEGVQRILNGHNDVVQNAKLNYDESCPIQGVGLFDLQLVKSCESWQSVRKVF